MAEPIAAIERRAIREFAEERTRYLWLRYAGYAGVLVLGCIVAPVGWILFCAALLTGSKMYQLAVARRALADGGRSGWRSLATAYAATSVATIFSIAVIWVHTDAAHDILPLGLLFSISLATVIDGRQNATMVAARQSLYSVTAAVLAMRGIAIANSLDAKSLVLGLVPVVAIGACAVGVSLWSARLYRQHIERESVLRDARDAAEEARQAKTRFVATVSHELRTPLNGILGMAQTLLRSGLTPKQHEQAEVIVESGKSLNALLNDILDYSKLEAGKLAIAPATTSISPTARHVERLYAPVAAEKSLDFKVTVGADVPHQLEFDETRFRQCLSNLISNAIKFTESGSVTVSIEYDRAASILSATVSDTGMGIPEASHAKLIQPFTQANATIAGRFGGTGLGLSITAQLAEAMGGALTFESAPGKGSVFRLSIRAADVGRTDTSRFADRKILVADDVTTNRAMIRLLLQPLGATVIEATDGQTALDALGKEEFAAAFLDLSMPGLGGAEVAGMIRRGIAGRTDLPLIAMTADSSLPDGAVFDHVIAKPIDPAALRDVLTRVVDRGA